MSLINTPRDGDGDGDGDGGRGTVEALEKRGVRIVQVQRRHVGPNRVPVDLGVVVVGVQLLQREREREVIREEAIAAPQGQRGVEVVRAFLRESTSGLTGAVMRRPYT